MTKAYELAVYIAISAGMALTTSCFAMIASMYGTASYPWIALAIVIAAIVCMLVSTSIAELASMFPSAPGVRTYLKAAYGDYFSLAMVSLYLMMAAMIGGIEAYILSLIVSDLGLGVTPLAVGEGCLVAIVVVNLIGLEVPRAAQLTMTAMLVAGVLAIAGLAFLGQAPAVDPAAVAPPRKPDDVLALLSAVAVAIFLFMGFEWVTPSGKGPQAYRWMIPLSMPVAIVLLGVLYLAFAGALSAKLDAGDIAHNVIPQMALGRSALGPWGYYLMALLTLLAALGAFNAGIMGASRLVYALGREGSLPTWCARISTRSGAPVGAILLVGAIAVAATLVIIETRSYVLAAILGVAIECLVYGALIFAVLRLRAVRSDLHRPFRTPVPGIAQGAVGLAMFAFGLAALTEHSGARGSAPSAFLVLVGVALAAAFLMRLLYNRRNRAAGAL